MREIVLVPPLRPHLVNDRAPQRLELGSVVAGVRAEIKHVRTVGDELVDLKEGRVDVDALHYVAAVAGVEREEIDVWVPIHSGERECVEAEAHGELVRGPLHRLEAEALRPRRHGSRVCVTPCHVHQMGQAIRWGDCPMCARYGIILCVTFGCDRRSSRG